MVGGHARYALLAWRNDLACPTPANSPFEGKGQFWKLSNPQAAADAAIAAFKFPAGPSRNSLPSQTVNSRQKSTVRCRKISPLSDLSKFPFREFATWQRHE
jgi:hypothetical protein